MTRTASERLRWIADYMGLAGKAVSMIACARGLDYSEALHQDAQSDLRAIATLLDGHLQFGEVLATTVNIHDIVDELASELTTAAAALEGLLRGRELSVGEVCDARLAVQRALDRLKEWERSAGMPQLRSTNRSRRFRPDRTDTSSELTARP